MARGQASLGLQEVGMLILVALVVVGLIYFSLQVYGRVLRPVEPAEGATLAAFGNLIASLRGLPDAVTPCASAVVKDVTLGSDSMLVAFDKTPPPEDLEVDTCWADEPVPRPASCLGEACVCLYSDGDISGEHLVSCERFGDAVFLAYRSGVDSRLQSASRIFQTPWAKGARPDGYAYVVYYGSCGLGSGWLARNLYVERTVDSGRSVYVLAEYDDSSKVELEARCKV